MTDSVTGKVSTTGGIYISGTASGLNTEALIEAAYQQKLRPIGAIEVSINKNSGRMSALSDLKTLATNLQNSVKGLTRPYGAINTTNQFDQKKAYLSSTSAGLDIEGSLGVSVASNAQKGNYNIEVLQTAKQMKATSGNINAGSLTNPMGVSGVFEIGVAGGDTLQVEFVPDMSLQQMVNTVNNLSSQTGVVATIINMGNGEYRMQLASLETGKEIELNHISGDNFFADVGMLDSNGDFQNITQAAEQAIIRIDGTEIISSSNNFEDVLQGVSFTVYGETAGSVIKLEIENDFAGVNNSIQEMVQAFNALREYVLGQQSYASDSDTQSALFADSMLRSFSKDMLAVFSAPYNNGGAFSSLADIGITFDNNNYLVISDPNKLESAILNNYSSLEKLFETQVETTGGNLTLLTNRSTLPALQGEFAITTDGNGAMTGVTFNGQSGLFEVSGTRIIGKAGTMYEGLTFVYSGGVDATITLNMQQGVGDMVNNLMERYGGISGQFQSAIDMYTDRNASLKDEISAIETRAAAYREKQVAKYAAMEAAVQAAKLLQKQIEAILGRKKND